MIHRLLLKKGAIRNDFIFIVFFAILIYAMVNRKGMISYLFNRLKFSNIYKTSYSIYIMQGIGFFITTQILAFFDMTRNDVWTMLFEMVVCILLGVITYLGVEKRATRYFRDKYDI